MSFSQANLMIRRLFGSMDAKMEQRFNKFVDISDNNRERNSRAGQYQLRGFVSNFPPFAIFGSSNGNNKVGP
jgi:hypothetical protein